VILDDTDVSGDDDADGRVQVTTALPDVTNAVRKSPLTYVELFVENQGPYRCLVDSGSEMPVAKRTRCARFYIACAAYAIELAISLIMNKSWFWPAIVEKMCISSCG